MIIFDLRLLYLAQDRNGILRWCKESNDWKNKPHKIQYGGGQLLFETVGVGWENNPMPHRLNLGRHKNQYEEGHLLSETVAAGWKDKLHKYQYEEVHLVPVGAGHPSRE